MESVLFNRIQIGGIELSNRIVRSATYEGAALPDGTPTGDYLAMNEKLSNTGIGLIITGFSFVEKRGRAMQTAQSGLADESVLPAFKAATDAVHKTDTKIFAQISHAGRQTLSSVSGEKCVAPSRKRSNYFREKPLALKKDEIYGIVELYGDSALLAKKAGFDGVQLHCAHGYLIHQFLIPAINIRKDEFGVDKRLGISARFLDLIIDDVRAKCGKSFPIAVKISGDDDLSRDYFPRGFESLIKFLDGKKIAAIEISYGTMDYPMNIFRGDLPTSSIFKFNPLFKTSSKLKKSFYRFLVNSFFVPKLKGFSQNYNLPYAEVAKKLTNIPVISVGGYRKKSEMEAAIRSGKTDAISICRPFLRELDFADKLRQNAEYESKCQNCNLCAVMCDSGLPTRCYKANPKSDRQLINKAKIL